MPPLYQMNDLLDECFVPVERAIESGAVPGAVLGIVDASGARHVKVAGKAQITPDIRKLGRNTWFDLASLTKVIFTTVKVLEETLKGTVELDAAITTVLPEFRQYHEDCWERQITFRQCLGHLTPLPAVEPLYTYGQNSQTLRSFILQREWKKGPTVYSDINFILLGLALERLNGKEVLQFNPGWGFSFAPPSQDCAATEYCSWRRKVICGQVHDENAYALGSAGHAGLFGRIDDLLDFSEDLLTGQNISQHITKIMRTSLSNTYTHGWQKPHKGWSGGDNCNMSVIGHTGFTGTGLWIDFERKFAWSLLSNRVHPTRHTNSGIENLRRIIGDIMSKRV